MQEWIARLASSDTSIAAEAAEALCKLGREAHSAAIALVRATGTRDESVRVWVTAALEEIGPAAGEQVDELIPLLTDTSSEVSFWAATLLGRAEAAAAPAVGALARLVGESPQRSTRERAAWALGKIGPAAATALPALHTAAASNEPRLSGLAKAALVAISTK